MSDYSIWILEYSHIPNWPIGALVQGRHNDITVKLPFAYVVIKGRGTCIVVDCGYDHDGHGRRLTEAFGIRNWHSPEAVLAQVGVSPQQVEHVIITHAHFDHMGALGRFRNARFYLQKRELERWVWALSLGPRFRWITASIDPADILEATELARAGRLVSLDGDVDDLLPGIDVRLEADTHTAGSQYVVVRNDGLASSRDTFVCAGDLVYRFENLDGGTPDNPQYVPVGYAIESQANIVMAIDRIVKAAGGDPTRVLPMHEERMGTLYPSRVGALGLEIVEVVLASGERSALP